MEVTVPTEYMYIYFRELENDATGMKKSDKSNQS